MEVFCFYAYVCVQLLSSADYNPSEPSLSVCLRVCSCWSIFFPLVWKMPDCMFVCVCVWEMFGGIPFDTDRVLEMQFPPLLCTRVFMLGLLEYESVALQCQR